MCKKMYNTWNNKNGHIALNWWINPISQSIKRNVKTTTKKKKKNNNRKKLTLKKLNEMKKACMIGRFDFVVAASGSTCD